MSIYSWLLGPRLAFTKISQATSHLKVKFHVKMKISHAKLIFIRESAVSYVKFMFRSPRFRMWNFEPVHFTCELGILYVKTSQFHMWNENFVCENVPIPNVFHMWNDVKWREISVRVDLLKQIPEKSIMEWVESNTGEDFAAVRLMLNSSAV